MSGNDVLALADRNMVRMWKGMVEAAGGVVEERDGLVLMASGIPIPLFNPVFAHDARSAPAATLDAAASFAGERGLPYEVYFRDAVAPGLADACAAAGLVEHWQPPLMVLDPISIDVPTPDGLAIGTVDEATADDYLETLCAGFGIPPDLVAALQGGAMARIAGFTGVIGRVDGAAVAAAGVFVDGTMAGIYNVATHPDHRHRGFGAAVTAAAVRIGADAGATVAILQSSGEGEPVYRRMGFVTADRYRQFESA